MVRRAKRKLRNTGIYTQCGSRTRGGDSVRKGGVGVEGRSGEGGNAAVVAPRVGSAVSWQPESADWSRPLRCDNRYPALLLLLWPWLRVPPCSDIHPNPLHAYESCESTYHRPLVGVNKRSWTRVNSKETRGRNSGYKEHLMWIEREMYIVTVKVLHYWGKIWWNNA